MRTPKPRSAAFVAGVDAAINNARAKAEIAIEKILHNLEHATMLRIGEVKVDTQNFETSSVEIVFREQLHGSMT